MQPRTKGAISLCPTGNSQGGHYFYSLTSGRRLNRNIWILFPISIEVIERVHQMAGKGFTSGEGLLTSKCDLSKFINDTVSNASAAVLEELQQLHARV